MRAFVLVLALALCGCTTLRPAGLPPLDANPRLVEGPVDLETKACVQLNHDYVVWGATAAGAAFLAGGGGLTAALSQDQPPRLTFGIISAMIGAASAVSTYLSNQYASEYAAQCSRIP